ncbi:uncharacterized protein DS421_3g70510 [Arachis hypogaea]|nr:uncharacterized protein DS421_3g70510 [Arachis hypogaea]
MQTCRFEQYQDWYCQQPSPLLLPPPPSLILPPMLDFDDPIDKLDFDDQNPNLSLDTTDPLSSTSYFYDPFSASLHHSFKTPRNMHPPSSNQQTHNHIIHFAIVKSGQDDHAKTEFGSDDQFLKF